MATECRASSCAVGPEPTTLEALDFHERRDLQPWIRQHPELIEPGLLLVAEEFADWEGAGDPVRDRLDLLFLSDDGRLLVLELKRGEAPDRTETQALLYAAFCDQLTTTDVVDQYAKCHGVGNEVATRTVLEHAAMLEDESPGRVRVRLLAEAFPPAVTTSVLFLRDIGSGGPEAAQLDIGCIKLTAYKLPDGTRLLVTQPLIPIPETEDYQVRKRRRDAVDDDARAQRSRSENAIRALQRTRSIPAGTELHLNREWFSPRELSGIDELLAKDSGWKTIEWTGETVSTRAVRSSDSNEPESLNGYYQALRSAAGMGSAPGATGAWLVGDSGKTIRELADEVLAGEVSEVD